MGLVVYDRAEPSREDGLLLRRVMYFCKTSGSCSCCVKGWGVADRAWARAWENALERAWGIKTTERNRMSLRLSVADERWVHVTRDGGNGRFEELSL